MNTTNAASTRFIHRTILSTTAAIFISCPFAATGVAQSEITDLAVLKTAPEKVAPNKELSQFRELSQPTAAAINNHLKDTVREEGFKALLEPLRHDDHVE
jgi:hypothetical protein